MSCAAHEPGEPGRDLRLLGSKRLHGAAVEDLALNGAALEHPALRLVELVEAHHQQRLQRRRHLDLGVVGGHREHLRDEQRVAARRVRDPLAQLARDGVADQYVGLLRGQRLQPQRRRPARAPLHQLGPSHAQQQKWRAGREQRHGLDQLEKRLLAPLEVVEDHDQRRLLLQQLPERPGDLVATRPDV